MSDFLDKYAERGLLSYLDITDDVEALLPGPSEDERNESRLRKVITGEKRPGSHTAKEVGAWTTSNVILPILAGAAKGAQVASKAENGARLINKIGKPGQTLPQAMKTAERATENYAKKTAARAAKKKAELKGANQFSTLLKNGLADKNPGFIVARAAKKDAEDVKKAIKIINKYPPTQKFDDIIAKEAKKSGKIASAATAGGVGAGNSLAREGFYGGEYDKNLGVEEFDDRIEMGKGRKAWQFIKGIFDLDELNPDIYPMDQVHDILNNLNENTNAWSQFQIDNLGDSEKIKLIKDIAKGKYDTDDKDLSYELIKSYLRVIDSKKEGNK